MRLIAGRSLQRGCFDLNEFAIFKKRCAPHVMLYCAPAKTDAFVHDALYPTTPLGLKRADALSDFICFFERCIVSKVIASSLRKGNVVDMDGKLCVVLSAQNIHPGKGTPVTQLDMRRISDGVKVSERYRTTETVERAYIDERDYQYLYQDTDGYAFMNNENFDQITVSKDIVGDQASYLQENMIVRLSLHDGNPVAIQLPARVTLEITETEPTTKGQTASSSYKPAILSNGARVMVPPHIGVGTRIVVHDGRRHLCGAGKRLRFLPHRSHYFSTTTYRDGSPNLKGSPSRLPITFRLRKPASRSKSSRHRTV